MFHRSEVKPVPQAETAECGLACLAMVSSYYGRPETLAGLRARYPVSLTGTSLKGLRTIAEALELVSRAVRCDLEELPRLQLPCILHWDLDHFVVLGSVGSRDVTIFDPAAGKRVMSFAEASKHFTGVALELTPSARFKKRNESSPLG